MKAILIDDEPLALDFLERQIKRVSTIIVVKKFTNIDIRKYTTLLKETDIAFLDIEMPEVSGLELAEQLLEVNPAMSIVFVTAFNEYAVEAFELNALDYVLKPVQLDRLQKTIERIKASTNIQVDKPLLKNKLHITVCKSLAFKLSKNTYETVRWRTTKAQELFLFLLHRSGEIIRKAELTELLWPDFNHSQAYSHLYTAIYHIRKTLSEFENHLIIKNMQEGYQLLTDNIFIDIAEWESSIKSAPPISLETIPVYEEKMDLYTGPYLQEYDYLWSEPERFRLEQLWLKIAYEITNCYVEHAFLKKAEEWYIKISTVRPEDENAHFSLMKLYSNWGLGLLVDHQYAQLKNALDELSVEVSPDIKSWYNQWKNNLIQS